jgi:hypothetical protein
MDYDYDKRAGFVYFVQECELKNIKIGFTSSHPARRLQTLSVASSQKLEFLGFMLGDKPKEKALHKKFQHLHVRNEWFVPGEELLDFISRLEYGDEFEKELSKYVKAP